MPRCSQKMDLQAKFIIADGTAGFTSGLIQSLGSLCVSIRYRVWRREVPRTLTDGLSAAIRPCELRTGLFRLVLPDDGALLVDIAPATSAEGYSCQAVPKRFGMSESGWDRPPTLMVNEAPFLPYTNGRE